MTANPFRGKKANGIAKIKIPTADPIAYLTPMANPLISNELPIELKKSYRE